MTKLYCIVLSLAFYGCIKKNTSIPPYSYYVPIGDTIINDIPMPISIQSNTYYVDSQSIITIGKYVGNTPIGKLIFLNTESGSVMAINNFIVFPDSILKLRDMTGTDLGYRNNERTYLNSRHIFKAGIYSSEDSDFSFISEDKDSVAISTHFVDVLRPYEANIFIMKCDSNIFRWISGGKGDYKFLNKGECINSYLNHISIVSDSTQSYRLIEPYFNYREYESISLDSVLGGIESQLPLLNEFYVRVVSGEAFYSDGVFLCTDDCWPPKKGEIDSFEKYRPKIDW
ncbi:MAG: hypothetical protein ACJAR8_001524 [Bacteroidia bacterium]|jgi:hypothetical protein